MNFRFTRHALDQMRERRIPINFVENICLNPEQKLPQSGGRVVHQSRVEIDQGKIHLIRVLIDPNDQPPAVVTVYKTSKIEKYWRLS